MTIISQPYITNSNGNRQFACFPAAILVYIINPDEEFLLLAHPARGGWEVVNGALEASETVLDGVVRETHEEAGPGVNIEPLGAVHVANFHYDKQVRYMFSINYLAKYLGGSIEPGDDMKGSQFGWFSLHEILTGKIKVIVPPVYPWLFDRALKYYRLLKDEPHVNLQNDLSIPRPNKYGDQV